LAPSMRRNSKWSFAWSRHDIDSDAIYYSRSSMIVRSRVSWKTHRKAILRGRNE
jgi:hypothetical protein